MDILLLVLGFLCVIGGIIGSILPVLPGSIMSWVGILLFYCIPSIAFDYWVLGISLLIVVIISILDYIIPAKGTKKFGGSKYGVWGTNIGMIAGFLIIPIPFGFVIGAFIGAFIGELFFDKEDKKRALKSATGAILGFLISSFMKLVICLIFLGTYIYLFWKNFNLIIK